MVRDLVSNICNNPDPPPFSFSTTFNESAELTQVGRLVKSLYSDGSDG